MTPTNKQLRLFGLIFGTVLFIWISLGYYTDTLSLPLTLMLYLLPIVCISSAIIRPALLNGFYNRWTRTAHRVNQLVISLLLIIIFYAVITPIALLKRALGKDEIKSYSNSDTEISNSYRHTSRPIQREEMETPF